MTHTTFTRPAAAIPFERRWDPNRPTSREALDALADAADFRLPETRRAVRLGARAANREQEGVVYSHQWGEWVDGWLAGEQLEEAIECSDEYELALAVRLYLRQRRRNGGENKSYHPHHAGWQWGYLRRLVRSGSGWARAEAQRKLAIAKEVRK